MEDRPTESRSGLPLPLPPLASVYAQFRSNDALHGAGLDLLCPPPPPR